ncbi:MAG: hypothetical protein K2X82_17000 [Gemmataceae bacterium]|nr:hypothetical protein [Gemmataceae bacterium]
MSATGVLTSLAGLLLAGVAAVLAAEARRPPAEAGRAAEFHRLTGGLGFGPATHLSGCPAAFDPRVCPRCAADLGSVPGGGGYCPEHAGSVFDYPPLPQP